MEPTVPTTPPPAPLQPAKSNKLVFILVAIIILLLGLGGGYFLKSQETSQTPQSLNQTQNQPTSTLPTATAIPTQSKAIWATYTSTKLESTSFNPYLIQYPETWTPFHKRDAITDTYTLTKGDAEIKIYQAPLGGSGCIFEGDVPQGPMQDLRTTKYTEVPIASGAILRRYLSTNQGNGTKIVYDFCGSANNKDWGTPTSFGAITYTSTSTFSDADLMEMDSILKTLQLVK